MTDDTPPPDDKPRPRNKQLRDRDYDEARDRAQGERRQGRRVGGRRPPASPAERRDEDEEDDYDPALKMVVPLNTSALAIIAGYVGLISVLCLPAPFALLLGILALQHLQKNPKLDGKGRAIFAIVMGTIFSLVLVLVGIAALFG